MSDQRLTMPPFPNDLGKVLSVYVFTHLSRRDKETDRTSFPSGAYCEVNPRFLGNYLDRMPWKYRDESANTCRDPLTPWALYFILGTYKYMRFV